MTTDHVLAIISATAADLGLSWTRNADVVTVMVPGTRKLTTECAFAVGEYSVEVRAFVSRHPDENHAGVYRWLLERNLRTYAVAFCVDHHGDIHLTGRVSREAVTPVEIDRILGVVAETVDDSFNTILELGFASSIRREWQWRLSRGEPTTNLAAFRHLAPERPDTPEGDR